MSPYAVRYRREKRSALLRRVYELLRRFDQTSSPPIGPLSHPAVKDVLATIDFPWEHMIESGQGETLWTLLSDLEPTRRLLPYGRESTEAA